MLLATRDVDSKVIDDLLSGLQGSGAHRDRRYALRASWIEDCGTNSRKDKAAG